MESISNYVLISSIVLFLLVFYRWLLRYLRRNDLTQPFPYVFPFRRKLFTKSELLRFELPESGRVSVELLNSDGLVIAELLNAEFPKGLHETEIDFSGQKVGDYHIRVNLPRQITTRLITLH